MVGTSPRERAAPGSTAALRPANERRVLALLRGPEAPGFTQAEIARSTGLAAGTVSSIVRELHRRGMVDTTPVGGRHGTRVRLSRAAGLVVGLDVGHTHLAMGLADLSANILAERRVPLAEDHEHTTALHLAKELLGELLDDAGHGSEELRTIALGLPAPVTHGEVRSSAILPGWADVHAAQAVEGCFGIPVHVDNDANLGALAEHRLGAGRGEDDLVFVKASSGVGAGLIVNGRLCRGSLGTAGELGHLTLDEHGPLCRCGSRGCLEAYASTRVILSMISEHHSDPQITDVVRAARDGDLAASRLIEDAGLSLGWGLATVVNLLNPGRIVVGGELVTAGELFLEPVRRGLRRHALAEAALAPVVASHFAERAPLVGAVLLAAERTELVA